MMASFHGHTAIVRALLGAGATLETINKTKYTCIRDECDDEIEIVRPAVAPRPFLRTAARSPAVCAAPLFHLAVR